VYIAGSSVAAALYSNISDQSYDDVDVFCSTPNALVSAVNQLRFHGWEFDPRFERVWVRWMKYGFKGWHTNSIKLEHPKTGIDVNVIYKMVDGHATTSLSQVIESFDFGLLAVGGWDMERGTYHDMRSYLFPANVHQQDLEQGRLPMLPNRRNDWRNGFISQYQGLREIGRYVKYVDYEYDMSLVKDDLLTGYWAVADYLSDRDKPEKIQLGKIYEAIALHLSADNLDQLREVGKEVLFMDSLDAIYESLE
jgi:hypothetical protein